GGTCRWWLKSHSRRAAPYTAMTMGSNGKVDYAGADVTSAILAVRPAISVDFSDIYRLLDPDDDPVSGTDVAKTSRETVVFGSYPKAPDCKLEPVEWEVLEREGDTALVISKYGIDVQPFHTDGCEWKDSDLRDWLNNWFIRDAFTDEERGRILETKVLTREGGMDTDEGSFTLDKLFLLDRNEALRYFGSDADRICNLTGYSEACNGYRSYKGRGCWWLRNQGVDYGTAIVEEDGSLDELGTVSASIDIAVRPVMRISLREDGGGREKTETDAKGVAGKEPATIFFGKYPQEPEGDMVPIEWRILVNDGEKALLVTQKAIEVLEFDNDRYYSECLKGCPDEKRWWADSFLRVWLNNCFVDNAFTDEERAKILYVTLNRDWSRAEKRSGEQIPDGGEKTDNGVVVFPGNEYYYGNLDRVFLLGEEETERYFESRYDMACLPTELAKSCGVYKTRRYSVKGVPTCPWWMNGNDGKGNKVFYKSGYNYWVCHAGDTAVRPAMWVTADALGDDNKGGD
ncbi:MAG: hypothetical protein J6X87_09305, partial [Clostridia bacterium]|nr:hypothetical protein [Clostridia bacterium]